MKIRYSPKCIRTTLMFWFLMTSIVPLFLIIDISTPIRTAFWSRVFFLLGINAVVCIIAIFLARSISRPIVNMTKVAEKMQVGDFSARCQIESRDEIGSLARSLNTMADVISSQLTVQQSNAEIMETIAVAHELQETGGNLLKKLIDLTHSGFGAFYIFNEDENKFENVGSIGIDSEFLYPFVADIREGPLGKALSTKSISIIRDIPSDTIFTFKSSTVTGLPKEIITVPLIAESKIVAIIALISLHEYSDESIEILNRNWGYMNAAISNLITNQKMRQHINTLDIRNVELQSQVKKSQTQSEQLLGQNGELKTQLEELQQEIAELQVPREPLHEAQCHRSNFLSNTSHEFRTPLNSILTLSHDLIVHIGESLSEREKSYLEQIENAGKTLLAIIDDIQDIPKIETEKKDKETLLLPLENEEILINDLSSSVQKNDCELMDQEMKLGGEKATEFGVCSPGIRETSNDMNGWGAFGKKLKRLIRDGINLGCRGHFLKKHYPSRIERAEKKIKKFIEADSEDTLPFS